jgi:hypothetical protein
MSNKHVYNFDVETGEFISETLAQIDPLETKLAKRNIYMLPANATFKQPGNPANGRIMVWDGEKWSSKTDARGSVYFDKAANRKVIDKLGKRVPKDAITIEPDYSLLKDPVFDTETQKWVNSELVYLGWKCETKGRVDKQVTKEIAKMGEEKAKTLYLIALGKGEECPEWDAFLVARQALLDEANAFIIKNNLL